MPRLPTPPQGSEPVPDQSAGEWIREQTAHLSPEDRKKVTLEMTLPPKGRADVRNVPEPSQLPHPPSSPASLQVHDPTVLAFPSVSPPSKTARLDGSPTPLTSNSPVADLAAMRHVSVPSIKVNCLTHWLEQAEPSLVAPATGSSSSET